VAALGAAAFGAGAVIGDVGDPGPGNVPPRDAAVLPSNPVPTERVPAKSGAPSGKIVYYETTDPLPPIAPGPGGYIFRKCPPGSSAVNGYYFRTVPDGKDPGTEPDGVFVGFGLDDQGSSPAGYRRWAFYWDNVTTQPIDGVTAGIVCDKDG
jgi:hypothetical protein